MTSLIWRTLPPALLLLASFPSQPTLAQQASWVPVGPDGGDARSFAADPSNDKHLYLGTTNSWIYQTEDGGASWQRLAKLAKTDDLMLDNIVVDESDPKTLLVGAWVIDHPEGGLFISHDAGKTWTTVEAMKGQSIRALTQAPSDAKVWIAGTLRGVFRSEDGGVQWTQITPVGSMDLHEVESIAIDPRDPRTVYAGTWHLPWKTTDGGANWHNIKQGLIDDSDVFSIIINPVVPNIVYTSACSGIYRSDNGGELYHKIQGIPMTARRTRVLMLDPTSPNTVYAGTTEGLYKTLDGGATFRRMTGPDVIVNDVYVDPKNPQHVLLATDRSGVLESDDAAATFKAANSGFSQRQVASLLVDAKTPQTILAGVVNDKSYGGVFVSHDGGANWSQQSNGLQGRDVFSLSQSADGVILAGTNAGIFRWDGANWQPDGKIVKSQTKTSYVVRKGKRVKVETTAMVPTARSTCGSATLMLPEASGMPLRRMEFTRARIRVLPGKAGRCWARRSSVPWLLPGRWSWQRSELRSLYPRMAERTGSRWLCRRSSPGCSPWRSRRMAACGWAAVKASSIAKIMVRVGQECPRFPSLTSADWLMTLISNASSSPPGPPVGCWASTPQTGPLSFGIRAGGYGHVHSSDGRLVAATMYNGVVVEPQKASKVAVAQTP